MRLNATVLRFHLGKCSQRRFSDLFFRVRGALGGCGEAELWDMCQSVCILESRPSGSTQVLALLAVCFEGGCENSIERPNRAAMCASVGGSFFFLLLLPLFIIIRLDLSVVSTMFISFAKYIATSSLYLR